VRARSAGRPPSPPVGLGSVGRSAFSFYFFLKNSF